MSDAKIRPKKPIDEPTIPISYSLLGARVLNLQVEDLPHYLANTDLSVESFLAGDFQINTAQQVQIAENGLSLSTDPLLGLKVGRTFTTSTHGAMGFMMSNCPNLWAALKGLEAYLPTQMDLVRLNVGELDGNWIETRMHLSIPVKDSVHRLVTEACATILFDCDSS